MIRHIVLVKFKQDVSEETIQDIWHQLHEIENKIEGLDAIHCGKSESPEKIERGYRHGFTVDFESWESLEHYQRHPEHKKLGARLVAHADHGIDGILVFDLPYAANEQKEMR